MNREQLFFELAALDVNVECLKRVPDTELWFLLLKIKELAQRQTHLADVEAAHEMLIGEGMTVCPVCHEKVMWE